MFSYSKSLNLIHGKIFKNPPFQASGRIKEWNPTAGQSCIIGITCVGLLSLSHPQVLKNISRPLFQGNLPQGYKLLGLKTKVKFELLASMA